jgi:hypothetical protein
MEALDVVLSQPTLFHLYNLQAFESEVKLLVGARNRFFVRIHG